MPANNQELPPKYYLHYFEYLLTFVEEKYADVIIEQEKEFIHNFRALSEDARCIFIRMMNRRGLFFRVEKFNYPEIEEFDNGLKELQVQSFASPIDKMPDVELSSLLGIFNKAELVSFINGT